MDGIIPLISQEPDRAPTSNRIIIGVLTDFKFSEMVKNMVSGFTLFFNPKTKAIDAPIIRIN